jgi:hypothetical protein
MMIRNAKPRSSTTSRHTTALAVLDAAHAVLERGWLQRAERVVRDGDGHLVVGGHGEVVRACLIGAVAEGARRYGGRRTSACGPALDALWAAYVSELRPFEGALGPVPAPMVRASRACQLAQWNDAESRTKEQVLALVEAAQARVRAELAALQAASVETAAAGSARG